MVYSLCIQLDQISILNPQNYSKKNGYFKEIWKRTHLHLQKFGNFPASIDVCNIVSAFTTNVMERRVDIEKNITSQKMYKKI
jgi:dTDP-4-dehydrorhamnose 3,5-epimerase-like enzyme